MPLVAWFTTRLWHRRGCLKGTLWVPGRGLSASAWTPFRASQTCWRTGSSAPPNVNTGGRCAASRNAATNGCWAARSPRKRCGRCSKGIWTCICRPKRSRLCQTPTAGSQAALSIAHSHGTAVALAVLDPEARVGIDLESLTHRREDFETIAFSPDERSLLAALPRDLRREWALRMWCAKEAVGKALGRGLSAGLLAFHVPRAVAASGIVEEELRDGALGQCPQLRGKSLNVYTGRESKFVFSSIIYQ